MNPLYIGFNLGHDAGMSWADDQTFCLAEMEKITQQKHICGATPIVERTMGNLLNQWKRNEGNHIQHMAFSDYYSSQARWYPNSGSEVIGSERWKKTPLMLNDDGFISTIHPLNSFANVTLSNSKMYLVRHHLAHAAAAYYCSSFSKALIVCLDGTANYSECGIVALAEGSDIRPVGVLTNIHGPRFGLLYESLARKVFGSSFATGKLLGLASYGRVNHDWVNIFRIILANNSYRKRANHLFQSVPDKIMKDTWLKYGDLILHYDPVSGGFADRLCSTHQDVLDWFAYRFCDEIGYQTQYEPLDFCHTNQTCRDLAATVQYVFEQELVAFMKGLRNSFPEYRNLCYGGGCALNIQANTKLAKSHLFEKIFIPSCCNDSGIALGAALAIKKPSFDERQTAAWTQSSYLAKAGMPLSGIQRDGELPFDQKEWDHTFQIKKLSDEDLLRMAADLMAQGKVLAYVEGHCETGPRSLGNRSIFAHPGIRGNRVRISEKIKKRESFRPLAPILLKESLCEYFSGPIEHNPDMLFSFKIHSNQIERLSEVAHVDGTARGQTVTAQERPHIYRLLKIFCEKTGLPVLINTSLNLQGKPIANSFRDVMITVDQSSIDGVVFMDHHLIMIKK